MQRVALPVSKVSRAGQARQYTDYVHRKYPGYNLLLAVPVWFTFQWWVMLTWNSNWFSSQDYKKDQLRSWKRRMGTGYGWSNDFGPEVTNIYKNLPSSAE
jgi:hypothetical protein